MAIDSRTDGNAAASIVYQHRSAVLIDPPSGAAGEKALRILDPIVALVRACRCSDPAAIVAVVDLYRSLHEATGLKLSAGQAWAMTFRDRGDVTTSWERMTPQQMRSWRALCLWRRAIGMRYTTLIDDILLLDRVPASATIRDVAAALATLVVAAQKIGIDSCP